MGTVCVRKQTEGAPGTVFPVGNTTFWGTRGCKREMATCHLVTTRG